MISAFILLIFSLSDYKVAKLLQGYIQHFITSYPLSISIAWLAIVLVPVLIHWRDSGLIFKWRAIRIHWKEMALLALMVLVGLVLFIMLGITKYFHVVAYPIVLFLVTPIVEELLFRGWIYGQIEKRKWGSPVVLSAVLFGLHHFQYFNYQLTSFAIFQICYTFILGLIFGRMRKLSGSIYASLLLHIAINYLTLRY